MTFICDATNLHEPPKPTDQATIDAAVLEQQEDFMERQREGRQFHADICWRVSRELDPRAY